MRFVNVLTSRIHYHPKRLAGNFLVKFNYSKHFIPFRGDVVGTKLRLVSPQPEFPELNLTKAN